jgi:hypothetical protein
VFDGHGGRTCAAHAAERLHAAALAAGLVPPKVASGSRPADVKQVRKAVAEVSGFTVSKAPVSDY